jgi:ribonucleoside-diphosphate reductase alpha chain
VLPINDDMGRDSSGIFQTLRDAALIQQTGGGNGFSFSRLRHKGSVVKSSMGRATGPVGFLRVYDKAFGEVAQGGTRRGANMAVLRVDHPDIREFITCKVDENQITNFNISVGVTDTFMQAVANDTTYDLIAPNTGKVVEQARAREIFDLIVTHAHHNGEPGLLFLDAANRTNPVRVGSHQPLRRAMAWSVRELLPGFSEPRPAHRPRRHGGLGEAAPERGPQYPLSGQCGHR